MGNNINKFILKFYSAFICPFLCPLFVAKQWLSCLQWVIDTKIVRRKRCCWKCQLDQQRIWDSLYDCLFIVLLQSFRINYFCILSILCMSEVLYSHLSSAEASWLKNTVSHLQPFQWDIDWSQRHTSLCCTRQICAGLRQQGGL